jgi:uncharacterized membrane protein (UPF0127 family)
MSFLKEKKLKDIIFFSVAIIVITGIFTLLGFNYYERYFKEAELSESNLILRNGEREYRFKVELAITPAQQARGLMDRQSMPTDEGMLFIFEREEIRSFWMKDTYIALDMIFFNSDQKFVSVSKSTTPCINQGFNCPSYRSSGPALYVLEINTGVLPDDFYNEGLHFELLD